MAITDPQVVPGVESFQDIGSNTVLPAPGMQGVAISNGALVFVARDGSKTPVSTGGSSPSLAQIQAQAATYVGANFPYYFHDWVHAGEGMGSNGVVGAAPAIATTGRSGGGKLNVDMTGAGGIVDYRAGVPFAGGNVAATVADGNNDPWFIAWRGAVTAVSAVGEIALCALIKQAAIGASDAGSQAYVYLGFTGSVSTTLLTLASWDVTTKRTIPTTVALPIALNEEHVVAMGYDGLGTIDVILDGIVRQSVNAGPLLGQFPTNGLGAFFMRTTSAAHNTVMIDYIFSAGVR